MRKPTDLCLLCKHNPATKTNSHILPRFISTGFMGPKGVPRKGFSIGAQTGSAFKPTSVQDSPKENYILCDECEAYFSILEGASAPALKNWQSKVAKGEFIETKISPFLSIVDCKTTDPVIMRLLTYSMFWRASISAHDTFSGYNLNPVMEESLRTTLLDFKALNVTDLKTNLGSKKVALHPYLVMTAATFKDETSNVLAAINPANPASLNVDKFGFILFEDKKDVKEQFMLDFGNITEQECKFMVVEESLWYNVMVKRPLEMVAAQVKKS